MNISVSKRYLLTALFCMACLSGYVQDTLPLAQQSSIPAIQQPDTAVYKKPVQKKATQLPKAAIPNNVNDTVAHINQADTGLIKGDAGLRIKDSIRLVTLADAYKKDTSWRKLLYNPYLPGTADPLYLVIKERQPVLKDEIFYLVAGLLLFLAFIKLVFPKYFRNIFRLFF